MAALAVAEGTAQGTDLHLQVRFFDESLRPGSGYQFLFADNLAGTFYEGGQDIKGTAAEPHRLPALKQEALRREEPVRAKRDRAFIHEALSALTDFYRILLAKIVATRRSRCPWAVELARVG